MTSLLSGALANALKMDLMYWNELEIKVKMPRSKTWTQMTLCQCHFKWWHFREQLLFVKWRSPTVWLDWAKFRHFGKNYKYIGHTFEGLACSTNDLLHQSVWPDWSIYWTLGNFLKPLATINLSKSPTF